MDNREKDFRISQLVKGSAGEKKIGRLMQEDISNNQIKDQLRKWKEMQRIETEKKIKKEIDEKLK